MYIVELNYLQPLAAVDELLPQHVTWLQQHFAAGHFISAGAKQPRTGGMILVKDMPEAQLKAILQQDPFQKVAEYHVNQVKFSRTGTGFEQLQQY
ncbi:YciI family protein [Acinetobacter sp. ME22]|uniref:YciI family protein n=1 Tax=Acinetobacter sp. ME22 TaxID=2904802 RepID=UPI001EDB0C5B|nr:YciI family protein [Acinetobacter sp. ME22]MCG2575042.1 YciI family protein [Acinetobacter sp. ME22]